MDALRYRTARLNASLLKRGPWARLGAVPSSSSFILPLLIDNHPSSTLLDSGATDNFIDPSFVSSQSLLTKPLPIPIQLFLFDGSIAANGPITRYAELPVQFPHAPHQQIIRFLVTPLEKSASAVLGLRWLTQINPVIDWKERLVTFRTTKSTRPPPLDETPLPAIDQRMPDAPADATPLSAISAPVVATDQPLSDPPNDPPTAAKIEVRFINAAAFRVVARHAKDQVSVIYIRPEESASDSRLRAASVAENQAEMSHLREVIPSDYHDFLDVFSKTKADVLPEHRATDHKIELTDNAQPPMGPIFPLSEEEHTAARIYIAENLARGFIRPSKAPCGAPILFVKKKDGSLRLCVDYRGLNKITRKDRYPLPRIPDLIDRLRSAKTFTKMDLRGAYNLVRIAEGDEWKTTFRTRFGAFEYRVMPFGLCNAPSTFQRFMNEVFADLLDISVIIYLDDILVFSSDPSQHTAAVREVLSRLRKHGLFAAAEKCAFSTDNVEFLGFVCTPDGIKMDSAKVDTVTSWPTPRNVRDVQSFLGFANFYRRFIHDYSKITVPLTRLTRKGTEWLWTPRQQEAFDDLKSRFTSAPVLTHWKPGSQLIVETDASDYAIAGILSTVDSDSEIRPIAFHSRTLTATELNYDTHDKELLAIFEAFSVWRHYLEGVKTTIDVVTDHKNLEYFATTKMLTRRQARWSEFLCAFNMLIRFRPGKLGAKPDALTRRFDVYPKQGDGGYASVNPQNMRPIFGTEQLGTSLRATVLMEPALKAANAIDVKTLQDEFKSLYPSDPLSQSILPTISENNSWSLSGDGFLQYGTRIYVPDSPADGNNCRLRILQLFHDHPLSGHYGIHKTFDIIARSYYWPELRRDVTAYVKSCVSCARNKAPRHKPYGLLKPLPLPERPWHSISMDYIEELPASDGHNSILNVVDRFTKQCILIPTRTNTDTAELARLFVTHVFAKHGVPSHITSDRGSKFTSEFFSTLSQTLGIALHHTAGYHPEGNGQTERVNQTIEQYIRHYCNFQQSNWAELLPLAEFAYNNAPNASTGISPFFANKGYNPSITTYLDGDLASVLARNYAVDLEQVHSTLREQLELAQKTHRATANRRRIPAPAFAIGDKAFVKTDVLKHYQSLRPTLKFSEKFLGPFPIISRPSSHSVLLELPSMFSRIHPVFHVSQLEPHHENPFPGRTAPAPAPEIVNDEPRYEVSKIVDSKLDKRSRPPRLQYLCEWAGYENTAEHREWAPAEDFEDDDEVVLDFHTRNPRKPGHARITKVVSNTRKRLTRAKA